MEIADLADRHRDAAVALWHGVGLTRPWNDPAADLERALAGPSSTVLGALDEDGSLLGTVTVGHDGHRGWLSYLAVPGPHRGEGIGRALVAAAEAWLGCRVPNVALMVREDNTAAVAFYERLGYERSPVTVLGRRPG
jgi:ribosomal protein S18 acetylase RimI-like enzyme